MGAAAGELRGGRALSRAAAWGTKLPIVFRTSGAPPRFALRDGASSRVVPRGCARLTRARARWGRGGRAGGAMMAGSGSDGFSNPLTQFGDYGGAPAQKQVRAVAFSFLCNCSRDTGLESRDIRR
eukprot:SAG31_NODE_572_length_13974_cov_28.935640_15_plen_125_part_00